jgi:PAS domain S-box-containing protein
MKIDTNPREFEALRKKAEALLKKDHPKSDTNWAEMETLKLIHEMEVYHIELIMQNEELTRAKAMALDAADKYAALYDFAPCGYFTLSKDGIITEINFCGSQMLGTPRSQLKNYQFGHFISNDTRSTFNLFFAKLFATKNKENCEVLLSTDDLAPTYVHITGIANENGEQCLMAMVDITKSKHGEKALEESERFLKETQAIANLGAYTLDITSGNWTSSEVLDNILGIDANFDRTFENWISIIHPDWQKIISDHLISEVIGNKKKFDKEYKIIRVKDKKERWVHAIGSLKMDAKNKPTILISTIREITERKQNEELLVKSEKKYKQIVETAQEGIWIINEKNKTSFVNQRMATMLGYKREEIIGKSMVDFMDPEEQVNALKNIDKRKKGIVEQREFVFLTKNGDNLFTLIETNPLTENNKYKGVLAMVMDITARKEKEMEIAAQNKKLHTQNKELEQFTYITSHDLQEPLSNLISIASLFEKEFLGKLDAHADQYLHYIIQSAGRMKELVHGLSEYTSIGKERTLTGVDCKLIVDDVLADLSMIILESNAQITMHDLPLINGYSTELRQLFQNLISNALKFRNNNIAPEINISAQKQEKSWLFSIKDNGIGIDEKDKDKIFVIFKRLHNRNEYKGTGIGLSHCKKIVELHGGNIWVESKSGDGSIFYFTISLL